MEDVLLYDFCKINIYNQYTIVEINEGVHLSLEHNTVLVNLVDTYYKNKPFIYITNRIHNYTVDPEVYLKTSEIKNLIGFAIVSPTHTKEIASKIGHLFKRVDFIVLNNLESAKDWAGALHDKQ
jgi:hypothetical protein